jgi:hypothetical protein
MASMLRPGLISIALLALGVGSGGCGKSNTIRVTGTLTKGGTAYRVPTGQRVSIVLYAVDVLGNGDRTVRANEPFQAQFNREKSTFEVPGPEGKGILPGKYRVSVVQRLTRDGLDKLQDTPKELAGKARVIDRETDLLNNNYGPKTSPIVRDLKSSGNLIIDLDRPDQVGPSA